MALVTIVYSLLILVSKGSINTLVFVKTIQICEARSEQHGGSVVFLRLCANLPPNLCSNAPFLRKAAYGSRTGQPSVFGSW